MYFHQKDWNTNNNPSVFRAEIGTSKEVVYRGASQARYTYSWRSHVPKGMFDPKGSTLGIRPPARKGSVVDILVDRKRYIEEIAETAAGARPNGSNTPGQTRVYPSLDTGHRFTSVKWSGTPSVVRDQTLVRGAWVDRYAGDFYAYGCAILPDGVAVPADFPVGRPPGIFPSALKRQDKINLMFHSMNPSKRRAQIGETLVSLLRGDVPTILKNVKQGIRQGRKAYRSAGSEYLNVQFGWLPLIGDIQNAIEVLTDLDHLVFDGSDRRKRGYEWSTVTGSLPLLNKATSAYTVEGRSAFGYNAETAGSYIASCDVRLSARLTPITRRTIASADFIQQAGDIASQLGVWYPALGWDLLPYSWLVDWATNIGRALENSLTYGSKPGQLNVDYAWATTKTVFLATRTLPNWAGSTRREIYSQPTSRETTVVKDRVQGTPFGFGLSFDGLNAWQVSILAALGLAHAR